MTESHSPGHGVGPIREAAKAVDLGIGFGTSKSQRSWRLA
jgi:hypothetical protein